MEAKEAKLGQRLHNIYKDQKLPGLFEGDKLKQSFDEHYVASNMEIIDPDNGEKIAVTRANIFRSIGQYPKAERVLMIGDPGNGKTTTFDEILSAYGKNEFVVQGVTKAIKVKLKTLLDEKWQASYGENIQTQPLLCLIHYSINRSIDRPKDRILLSELETVLSDENRDKVVLLFDGYEAVAHLADRPGIVRDIISEALEGYKYFMMASRPNVVTDFVRNQFDRVIEVTGLDKKGVKAYITQYFARQHEALKAILNKHHDKKWEEMLSHLKNTKRAEEFEEYILLTKIGSFKAIADSNNYREFAEKIEEYYEDTRESLIRLLDNPSIREMASNPMKAAMLCMVYSDPQVRMNLKHNFTLTELYHEVIALMSVKFKSKVNLSGHGREIDSEDALVVLKEIAYQSFKQNDLITGHYILELISKTSSKNMTIEDLYKFGLLKIATTSLAEERHDIGEHSSRAGYTDRSDLQAREHMFIQASFKKYFAAIAIAEKLQSSDENIYKEAAKFVAYNRNKPSYLNLFKLVAEILGTTANEVAIRIFYEAIECNIEGVLQLGIEGPIMLLMHLFGQIKLSQKMDTRIANVEKAISFIDDNVDIFEWKEEIKESGYLSKKMEEDLWAALENDSRYNDSSQSMAINTSTQEDNSIDKIKIAIEIAGNFLDQLDIHRLWGVLFNNLVQEETWQIQRASMNVLAKIIANRKMVTNLDKSLVINQFASCLIKDNLKEAAANVFKAFIEADKDDTKLILAKLISIIDDRVKNEELYDLIHEIINSSNDEILNFALDLLIPYVQPSIQETEHERPVSIRRDVSEKSEESNVSNGALIIIKNAIINARFANLALDKLIAQLRENDDQNIAYVIGEILAASEIEFQRHRFNNLMTILHEESTRSMVISTINSVSRAGITMSDEFSSKILIALKEILDNSDIPNKYNIILAIEKMAIVADGMPTDVRQAVLTSLTASASDFPIAYMAMAKIASNGEREVLKQVIDVFAPILEGEFLAIEAIIDPLSQLTAGDISFNIAENILKKMLELFEDDNRFAVPIANMAIRGHLASKGLSQYIGGLTDPIDDERVISAAIEHLYPDDLSQYFDRLIERIDDERIISAIDVISSNRENLQIKNFLANKLITSLKNLGQYKANIIKSIDKMIEVVEPAQAQRLLDLYKAMLKSGECDGKVLAYSIGNVVAQVDVNSANEFVAESLIPMIKEGKEVAANAIYSVGKIAKQIRLNPQVMELVLGKMIALAKSQEKFRKEVLYAMSKLIDQFNQRSDHTDQIIDLAVSSLSPQASDKRVFFYSAEVIKKLAVIYNDCDEMLQSVLTKLQETLSLKKHVDSLQEAIESVVSSMSFASIVLLLKEGSQNIRQIAAKVLVAKLPALQNTWEDSISNMLQIISNNLERGDLDNDGEKTDSSNNVKKSPSLKKLYDAARRVIDNKIKVMDEDNLEWINANFDQLVDLSKWEAEPMMRLIFHNTLSDNEITHEESKFIIKCLTTFDFTITLSTSNDGLILQFENGMYKLKGGENKAYIENIVNAVLSKTEDPLVKQHINYEPLFVNSGSALGVSPIDVKDCPSLLSGNALTMNQWQMSLVYLSDHAKSSPENAFLLIEGREAGDYVAYKIYVSNSSKKIKIIPYRQHPNNLNLDSVFREEIFGQMKYDHAKVRYYAKTIDISPFNAKAIMEEVEKSPEIDRSSSKKFDFELLPSEPIARDASPALEFHCDSLSSFRSQASSSPSKKAETIKIKDIIRIMHDLISKIDGSEEIKGDWNQDKFNFKEFGRELILAKDHQASIDFGITSLMSSKELDDKAKEEIESIEADTYKNAYYYAIINSLNAVYLASSSISSQMVENKKHGITGSLGTLLNSVSSHIPFAGLAVDLIGNILQGLDQIQQERNIENYLSFARDAVIMSEIVEEIARILARRELKITQDSASFADSIDTVSSLINGGVQGAVVSVSVAAIGYLTSDKQDERITKAQEDANIVAKLIIKNIFAGKYAQMSPSEVSHKAKIVASDVVSVYEGDNFIEVASEIGSSVDLNSLGKPAAKDNEVRNPAVNAGRQSPPAVSTCCGKSCIIMTAMTESDDPFTNDPQFQEILQLPPEERVTAYRKLYPVKNFFLADSQGLEFLREVKARYGIDALEQMYQLGETQEVAEQILSEVGEQGSEAVLEVFFGATMQRSSDNFEKIVANHDGSLAGYHQYLNNAFKNNIFSKSAGNLIKTINYLYETLEKSLDMGASSNKIAIITALLEGFLGYAASGIGSIVTPPPYYDPGDHGGGYSGGGGGISYESHRDNNANDTVIELPLYNATLWDFKWE